jgi:hypothetical protein
MKEKYRIMTDSRARSCSLTCLCIILLSLVTVSVQVRKLTLDYIITGTQQERHHKVLEGKAGNPWQYRVLSEYIVDGALRAAWKLDIPKPVTTAFIGCRIIQNLMIFILCLVFYRMLGINHFLSLLGMGILAWSMTHSLYDSDLQYNTYSDVIFYLVAGICLVRGKYIWILPITLFAALNRETSGLIPILLAGVMAARGEWKTSRRKYGLTIVVTSLAVFIAVFVWLRLHYGEQKFLSGLGHQPGKEMFLYNIRRLISWEKLFVMLGIIPFIALFNWRNWPVELKYMALVLLPVWFVIMFLTAIIAEARIFLVPQALIFIPGALINMGSTGDPGTIRRTLNRRIQHSVATTGR